MTNQIPNELTAEESMQLAKLLDKKEKELISQLMFSSSDENIELLKGEIASVIKMIHGEEIDRLIDEERKRFIRIIENNRRDKDIMKSKYEPYSNCEKVFDCGSKAIVYRPK